MMQNHAAYAPLRFTSVTTDSYTIGTNNCLQLAWYPMNVNPTNIAGTIVAGDALWTGMYEYARFYGNARSHGCKISVRITQETSIGATAQLNSSRAVLIALPIHVDGGSLAFQNQPSVFGALSYQKAKSCNGAKSVVMANATAGGSTRTLSMYRSTRAMFDKSSIRDDPGGLNACNLDPDMLVTPDPSWSNPVNSWAFILNIYSDDTDPGQSYTYTVDCKLTGYWEFYARRLIVQDVFTS